MSENVVAVPADPWPKPTDFIQECPCSPVEWWRARPRLWHCVWCAHHWPEERDYCANCHEDQPGERLWLRRRRWEGEEDV